MVRNNDVAIPEIAANARKRQQDRFVIVKTQLLVARTMSTSVRANDNGVRRIVRTKFRMCRIDLRNDVPKLLLCDLARRRVPSKQSLEHVPGRGIQAGEAQQVESCPFTYLDGHPDDCSVRGTHQYLV
jgi:hypothetical protein